MTNTYSITFRWYDTNTYCSNLAIAPNADAVRAHYSKHEIISLEEAKPYEIEEAKRKGKPIITIN